VQGKYEGGNRQGQGELVKVDGEVSVTHFYTEISTTFPVSYVDDKKPNKKCNQ
jgi:hypothetical protein